MSTASLCLSLHLHSHDQCPSMSSADICSHTCALDTWPCGNVSTKHPALCRHTHSHAQCPTLLSVGTRTHNDHQVPVVSVGTRPHVPTVLPCLLQALAFTCPLLSSYCTSLLSTGTWSPMLTAPSGHSRLLHSHAHSFSVASAGHCPHMDSSPVCPGQAPALTYPLPPLPLHVSTLTCSLPSLASAGTYTEYTLTPTLCPLQAPVPTCPVSPSDLCGHLHLHIHDTLVSADT